MFLIYIYFALCFVFFGRGEREKERHRESSDKRRRAAGRFVNPMQYQIQGRNLCRGDGMNLCGHGPPMNRKLRPTALLAGRSTTHHKKNAHVFLRACHSLWLWRLTAQQAAKSSSSYYILRLSLTHIRVRPRLCITARFPSPRPKYRQVRIRHTFSFECVTRVMHTNW